MRQFPLAIYTAEHGLAWTYPRDEIAFADLDATRKVFGLPDFDSGAPGYEGVWVTEERVFVMRCQSVPRWDFRGRDATYLSVTWMTRADAVSVDFERLLECAELREPTHTPKSFFVGKDLACTMVGTCTLQSFSDIGMIILKLAKDECATFRRDFGSTSIQMKRVTALLSEPMVIRSSRKVATSSCDNTGSVSLQTTSNDMQKDVMPEEIVKQRIPLFWMMLSLILSINVAVLVCRLFLLEREFNKRFVETTTCVTNRTDELSMELNVSRLDSPQAPCDENSGDNKMDKKRNCESQIKKDDKYE